MEEEDLIETSDDDTSASDSEEIFMPSDKTLISSKPTQPIIYTKTEFILTLLTLIFSSVAIIIILPLYLESVNVNSDVYSLMSFTSIFTCTLIFIIKYLINTFRAKTSEIQLEKLQILKLGLLYTVCGFLIVYGMDRKRVMCHIQDPLKGIVAIFVLIFYFLFCKKLMRLQAIFSATTVIIGLFVSIDYGLCDKFRCRGLEFEHPSEDVGFWSWKTHMIWTIVYIFGLGLFSGFFMLLERYIVPADIGIVTRSSMLLSTVSRLVSTRDIGNPVNSNIVSEIMQNKKTPSAIHLASSIHGVVTFLTICLMWTDFISDVGKVSSVHEFLNHTSNIFSCSFSLKSSEPLCGNILFYSWLFILFYTIFFISSIRFLIMSQSAVFTVVASVSSLPLVSIWWSLFRIDEYHPGWLIWAPSMVGEFICAILGLPIVLIGLAFLCKSNFQEHEVKTDNTQRNRNQLA